MVTEETTDEHESTDEGTKKDDDLPGGADPAPRFFSLDTPSGRYSIAVGGSATLELPGDLPRPELTGTSVELIDMAAFAPTGTNQWEIRGKEGGTSEIRVGVDGPRWELVVP